MGRPALWPPAGPWLRGLLLLGLCCGLSSARPADQLSANITGAYTGTWHQAEATRHLKDLNGTIELFLRATPSNHSRHRHGVWGEIHLGRPLNPSRFTVRGEYDTGTGELLLLSSPVMMGKFLHDPRHLNFSRVWPSYQRATQQVNALLHPPNATLTPLQMDALANRTGFVPELLDPHWEPLRADARTSHCVGFLRLQVAVDPQDGDYTVRSEDDILFQPKLASGTLVSELCNVTMRFTASTRRSSIIAGNARVYALALAAVVAAQLASLTRQMEYTTTQAGISAVSLYTIGHLAYLDFFMGLTHLGLAVLFDPAFKAFAVASFLKFCLCALFELKYLHAIWKAQRPSQPATSVRCLCLNMYLAVFFGVYILWRVILALGPFSLFLVYSFWLPQILSNILRNSARPLQLQFIIVTTLSHAFPAAYFLGCPANVLQWRTHPALLHRWLAFHAALAGVLVVQYFLGPRVFVPSCLLPTRYDYHRPYDRRHDVETGDGAGAKEPGGEEGEEECAICRSEVDLTQPALYMVTPCDHVFHAACLGEWLYYKMECPICRGRLPDL